MYIGKRRRNSRQLYLECAAVAAVVLLVIGGGSFSNSVSSPAWANLQNPLSVTTQPSSLSLQALAVFYNTTLTSLGQANFTGVTYNIASFKVLNVPGTVSKIAQRANGAIDNMNLSISSALTYFNKTRTEIDARNFFSASAVVKTGCSYASTSEQNFASFGLYTQQLKNASVPVSIFARGSALVGNETLLLQTTCNNLESLIQSARNSSSSVSFTISSPQTAILAAGGVTISGTLTWSGVAVGHAIVLFYYVANGTNYLINNTATTGAGGSFVSKMQIPAVYVQNASIYAYAQNSTANDNFPGKTSNDLNFTILWNETSIAYGDPRSYLPQQSFAVVGNLSTGGKAIISAPVTVTVFGNSNTYRTNATGWFGFTVTVPTDVADGNYSIVARFAGATDLGPTQNTTYFSVYRYPLDVTLGSIGYSLAGLTGRIAGTAVSENGTKMADANVTVNTPWGAFPTTTNSNGSFSLSIPVPITNFEFAQNLSAVVAPAEPYAQGDVVYFQFKVFNLLWIAFPAAAVLVAAYEVRNLDLSGGILRRTETSKEEAAAERKESVKDNIVIASNVLVSDLVARAGTSRIPSKIVEIYREALSIAMQRFKVEFESSMTVREIASRVDMLENRDGAKSARRASRHFYSISLAMEDYLYARVFDEVRVGSMRDKLEDIRAIWSADDGSRTKL